MMEAAFVMEIIAFQMVKRALIAGLLMDL